MALWLLGLALAATTLAQNLTTFFSAPSFSTLPFNISNAYSDLQTEISEDAYFLTCIRGAAVKSLAPAIYDTQGNLVWMNPDLGECFNLDEQTYNGKSVLTVWVGSIQGAGWGIGKGIVLDDTYSIITNVTTSMTNGADVHEFNIPSQTNSTALLTAYSPIPLNLTPYGGPDDGWLLDAIFQEVDIASGNVIFNWSSFDHLSLNDSFADPGTSGNASDNAWDAVHINSIDKDDDGNYLVSSRHLHQLYKVDKNTGDIIWRLGGKTNDFQMGNGTAFFWQHHARWHENFTHISVFDNGASNWETDEPTARGLYLSLDFSAMSATLVNQYLPVQVHQDSSQSQGSVQILDNGNVVVGYGSNPWITEHTNDGTVVFATTIGPSSLPDNGPVENYRTIKTTTWVGRPSSPPTLAAINSSSGLDVYVSWNGATHVSAYTLLAGANASALTSVSNTSRSAFETHMNMAEAQEFVAVTALASNGTELGRTGVIRVSDGTFVQDGIVFNPSPSTSSSNTTTGGSGSRSNGAASLRDGAWAIMAVGAVLLLSASSNWLC